MAGSTQIKSFQLRPAAQSDIKTIFEWANDKEARENSFHTEAIIWPTHQEWFRKKITDPEHVRIFIAEFDHEPVGQIRFERGEKDITIAFLVDKHFRGCGFGRAVLENGLSEIQKIWREPKRYIGIVKRINVSSRKIFETLGFKMQAKEAFFEFSKVITARKNEK